MVAELWGSRGRWDVVAAGYSGMAGAGRTEVTSFVREGSEGRRRSAA